jgi:hypothetical protein
MVAQPLYLANAFWGSEFRRYFCDACLPTLLAPGNLAALDNDADNAIVIATTEADWNWVREHPTTRAAEQYFRIIHLEIPPVDADDDKFARVALAYATISQRAFADRARAFLLSPDLMLADGSLAYLQKRVDAGIGVIFVCAWRSDETKLFAALAEEGFDISSNGAAGRPLAIGSRPLVRACLKSIHLLETDKFWESRCFSRIPGIIFWQPAADSDPASDEIVAHAFAGVPFIDFSKVTRHDMRGLSAVSFDAYPARIAVEGAGVELVDDSDKAFIASWTPTSAERWANFQYSLALRLPVLRTVARCARIRAYARHVFVLGRNRLIRQTFAVPIRIHGSDRTSLGDRSAAHAANTLAWSVGDMLPHGSFPDSWAPVGRPWHPWWWLMRLAVALFAFETTYRQNCLYVRSYWYILKGVLRGDPVMRSKLAARLRQVLARSP